MNDLEILRDSWETPGRPDDTARAAARAALMERAAAARGAGAAVPPAERARRRPRLRMRLAVAGVAAAAVAAGGIVAWPERGRDVPALPSASPVAATQALDRAATAAERRAFTPPRPDQWVYTHYRNVREPQRGPERTEDGGPGMVKTRVVEERWARADGTVTAFRDGGQVQVVKEERPPRGTWPPKDYAGLAKLPTDPDELLALVYRHGGAAAAERGRKAPDDRPPGCGDGPEAARDNAAFDSLLGILGANLLPPKVEAAVYRAMRKVPGVASGPPVGLDDGRPGIALGRRQNGWQTKEVLFDAETYRYAGQRSTAYDDPAEVARRCGWARIGGLNMRVVSVGVVDKAGQRP
ncbi:CU044_5270 family protein [Spirillospora sp. NPDC050679]